METEELTEEEEDIESTPNTSEVYFFLFKFFSLWNYWRNFVFIRLIFIFTFSLKNIIKKGKIHPNLREKGKSVNILMMRKVRPFPGLGDKPLLELYQSFKNPILTTTTLNLLGEDGIAKSKGFISNQLLIDENKE